MRIGVRLLMLVLAVGVVVPIVVLFSTLSGEDEMSQRKKSARIVIPVEDESKTVVKMNKEPGRVTSPLWWVQHIQKTCKNLGYTKPVVDEIKPEMFRKFLVDDQNKLIYCPIPKVASTTWRRIFLVLSGKVNTSDPMSLKSNHVHGKYDEFLTYLGDLSAESISYRLKHYFKFVFVREPFERILSAFRNKFETKTVSADYFKKSFGRKIIEQYRKNASKEALEKGSGLTFEEFLRYITDPQRKINLNEHWERFHELCHPCVVNYDFIGKLNNVEQDSKFVLQSIGADNIKFPSRSESKYPHRSTNSYMTSYYSQLKRQFLVQIYSMYKADFAIFNFTIPDVIKDLLKMKKKTIL